MTALATIAIAAAALAGGEVVTASGPGTPLVGESCAFGINAMATYAIGAGTETAEAVPPVYTHDSRLRIGRRKLRPIQARIGGTRI